MGQERKMKVGKKRPSSYNVDEMTFGREGDALSLKSSPITQLGATWHDLRNPPVMQASRSG